MCAKRKSAAPSKLRLPAMGNAQTPFYRSNSQVTDEQPGAPSGHPEEEANNWTSDDESLVTMESELSHVYNKYRYLILSIPESGEVNKQESSAISPKWMSHNTLQSLHHHGNIPPFLLASEEPVVNASNSFPLMHSSIESQRMRRDYKAETATSMMSDNLVKSVTNDNLMATVRATMQTSSSVEDKRRMLNGLIGDLLKLHESLSDERQQVNIFKIISSQ